MPFEPVVFVVDDDESARKSVCALVRSLGLWRKRSPPRKSFSPAIPADAPAASLPTSG